MAKTILDFGEKIGGARKDFYAVALNTNDLDCMNDAEKKKYVKRDSIWKKEDPAKLVAAGIPREIAYWRNEMRLCMHAKPGAWDSDYIDRYITGIGHIRDLVQAVTTIKQQQEFFEQVFAPICLEKKGYGYTFRPELRGICLPKVYNIASYPEHGLKKAAHTYGMTQEEMIRTAAEDLICIGTIGKDTTVESSREQVMASYSVPGGRRFFYGTAETPEKENWIPGACVLLDGISHRILSVNCTREEAQEQKAALIDTLAASAQQKKPEKGKRKKAFPIPQLARTQRMGPQYRETSATGEDLLHIFQIRGGEFGRWMSDADASESLNQCHDAFRDLARVLDIHPESISFHGALSIGFGSRGHSAAAAHYEPARQVINLTKYRGQGALCHEWAHALDHAIGRHYGCLEYASEGKRCRELPEAFRELMNAMTYKTVVVSEDEFAKEKETAINRLKEQFVRRVIFWKPKCMAENDETLWDDTVTRMWDTCDSELIDTLSDMRKKISGRVIPKKEREDILWYVKQGRLEREKTQTGRTKQVYTDFYTGSQKFNDLFGRMGHQYWSSRCEMFARAFDCFVSDQLKERGEKNFYLTYGADAFAVDWEGKYYAAVPEGEEREVLNRLFKELLKVLKCDGVL